MKPTLTIPVRSAAFTLVELMIVVSIIAILAALIFPAFGHIKQRAAMTKARTELKQLESAIGSYKTRYGFFPPDTRTASTNQLYYELVGTSFGGVYYTNLDKSFQTKDALINSELGVQGLMNCSRSGGDDVAPAVSFLKGLKPGQYHEYGGVRYLTCSVSLNNQVKFLPCGPDENPNPWRYNSSNPTNNVGQYDLWVDLIMGGKTNRISNWSSKPQIVY